MNKNGFLRHPSQMLAVWGTKENRCASVSSSWEELEFTPPECGRCNSLPGVTERPACARLVRAEGVHVITRPPLVSLPQIRSCSARPPLLFQGTKPLRQIGFQRDKMPAQDRSLVEYSSLINSLASPTRFPTACLFATFTGTCGRLD